MAEWSTWAEVPSHVREDALDTVECAADDADETATDLESNVRPPARMRRASAKQLRNRAKALRLLRTLGMEVRRG